MYDDNLKMLAKEVPPLPSEKVPPIIDADKKTTIPAAAFETAMQNFQSEQNLIGGTIAGFVAAVVGAAIWATVTVITEYQIGWMAIALGLLVAFAIRTVGKGLSPVYRIVGAFMALLGCLLGNLFSVCYFVSVNEQIPFSELLPLLTPEIIIDLMKSTFSPIDLLFYGLAVYEGYRLSVRNISQENLAQAIAKNDGSSPDAYA